MSIITHFPADSLIQEPVLARVETLAEPLQLGIRPLEGRRWLADLCCSRIWLDHDLTSPEATAALDEALDAVALHQLGAEVVR